MDFNHSPGQTNFSFKTTYADLWIGDPIASEFECPNDRITEALNGVGAYPMKLQMKGGWSRIAVGLRDRLAGIDATVSLEIVVGDS